MIARIIMSEHPNEKDLEHFSSDHKEAVKDGFLANTQFSISCLLYTSPSPRDYAASRMPSSA